MWVSDGAGLALPPTLAPGSGGGGPRVVGASEMVQDCPRWWQDGPRQPKMASWSARESALQPGGPKKAPRGPRRAQDNPRAPDGPREGKGGGMLREGAPAQATMTRMMMMMRNMVVMMVVTFTKVAEEEREERGRGEGYDR